MTDIDKEENAVIQRDRDAQAAGQRHGLPALFPCPHCGGQLWEMNQGNLTRFRCHTGHILTAENLLRSQFDLVETSLWIAARTLADKSVLYRQSAMKARARGEETGAARFEEQAGEADGHSQNLQALIRQLIREDTQDTVEDTGEEAGEASEAGEMGEDDRA